MKSKEIKSLVVRFGQGLDYFQLTFGAKAGRRRELSLGECLAVADSDPAFLWNLATSEALGGRPLPPFVCSSAALRTNSYFLCPDHPDVHVAVVHAWGFPKMKTRRDFLRALFCCPDISLEGIGQECGLETDEVRLLGQLRWNFRDRVNEPAYVAQLLYPNTRFPGQAMRLREQEDVGLRLCRLGYEQGFRAVLKAAGPCLLEDGRAMVQASAQKTSSSAVLRAGLGFDMGLTEKRSNPELALAHEMGLLATPDQIWTTDDLSAMSLSRSMNECFMALMRPGLDRRVAVQLGLSEAECKLTADGRAAVETNPAAN